MARSTALLFAMVVALCLSTVAVGALEVRFATRGQYTMQGGNNKVSCSPFDGLPTCSTYSYPTNAGNPTCCESQARWGYPTSGGQRSGIGFSGMAENNGNQATPPGTLSLSDTSGTPFRIGVNTHYNYPISSGAATRGNFKLTLFQVSASVNGGAFQSGNNVAFDFSMKVDETENNPNHDDYDGRGCPYTTRSSCTGNMIAGWRYDNTGLAKPTGNGCTSSNCCSCSDRVYFDQTAATTATGVIKVGSSNYTITMVGFSDLQTYDPDFPASTSFISQEAGSTTKYLFAAMTIVCQCPPPQVTTSNDVCTCACPATGPQSQSDCPNADYVYDAVKCTCNYQGSCAQQIKALSPTLNTMCETTKCELKEQAGQQLQARIPYVGPVWTLSVVPNTNNSRCSTTSSPQNSLCKYKCVTNPATNRSSCQQIATPDCSVTTACKVGSCVDSTGQCTVNNAPLPTTCTGSNPCATYTCLSNGTCAGTVQPCSGVQVRDPADGCKCKCPSGSPTSCGTGQVLDALLCTCKNSNCTVQYGQITANPPDSRCEDVSCSSNGLDLVVNNLAANNTACRNPAQSDLCVSRCVRYNDGYRSRARCESGRPTCAAAPTCQTRTCNPANGACELGNQAPGSPCTGSTDCYVYTCTSGSCNGVNPCPSPKVPGPKPACSCACPPATGGNTAASQADCQIDWTFDSDTCTCKPSRNCVNQIKALNPPLDSTCEQPVCDPETSVLTVTSLGANASRCINPETNPDLCNARCVRRTDTSGGKRTTGSYCYIQPVKCANTTGCNTEYCDVADGKCKPDTLAPGSVCVPPSGVSACTTYSCSATAECVGEYQCTLNLPPSQLACRDYRCDSDSNSNTYNQCVFSERQNVTKCDDSPCSERSECVEGNCKSYNFDCTTQEAVDAGIEGASTAEEDCLARICKFNTTTGTAACEVDYYYDKGTPCPNKNCKVNSECDGEGVCRGEADPDCSGGGDSRKAEIIGSAAAGGVLSVVGAGAVLFAAAGAGVLAWQIRRRKLLNFESWEAGTMSGATVSPLYVPTGTEHVNPLSEL